MASGVTKGQTQDDTSYLLESLLVGSVKVGLGDVLCMGIRAFEPLRAEVGSTGSSCGRETFSSVLLACGIYATGMRSAMR
jgi:hypothetical protein